MTTPPLLTGATLLFWGFETGGIRIAVLLALLLESSRLTNLRWVFSTSELSRIVDLCTVIFMGIFIYLLATSRSFSGIITALMWLPLSFFPLVVAEAYSMDQSVPVRALSLIARKGGIKGGEGDIRVNLSWPYFVTCVVCAGAANNRTQVYYAGIFVFSAWALFTVRSKRYPPLLWGALLIMVGAGGYAGQAGLSRLQYLVEQKTLDWYTRSMAKDADPFGNSTAMGEIGKLKQSDRILFRVKPEEKKDAPMLLRGASYNRFFHSKWFAVKPHFRPVKPDKTHGRWTLAKWDGGGKTLRVSDFLQGGRGLLKLPPGVFRIEELPVKRLSRNRYGAVKVEEGPHLVEYGVRFMPGRTNDAPPMAHDLFIPDREMPHIRKIAEALAVSSGTGDAALKAITDFFHGSFTYSLVLDPPPFGKSPLEGFLTRYRSGHCEYFASATVLLLRACGIPARYATGYSVNEYSRMEDLFLVREKDAHSWALAYLNGTWRNVDTTPPAAMDIGGRSGAGALLDLFSFLNYLFARWWWQDQEGVVAEYGGWILLPLVAFLAFRLLGKKRVKTASTPAKRGPKELFATPSSDFDLVERRMNAAGYFREPWEPLCKWLNRLEEKKVLPELPRGLLTLHYRHRFDPAGITPAEKEALTAGVRGWLAEFDRKHSQFSVSTFDKNFM